MKKDLFRIICAGVVTCFINRIAYPIGWVLLGLWFFASIGIAFLQYFKKRQMSAADHLDSTLGDSDVESTKEITEI